jgi:hypothetical protein
MEGIKKINVEFNGITKPTLNFTKDVSSYPVIKFMALITNKYAVSQDSLYSKWTFLINGKPIESEFAAKTTSLRGLKILSEPVLIQISYKEEERIIRQEGRKFDLGAKLRKSMKESEKNFLTNLKTNGMVTHEILNVMGHFQSKLKEIELVISMEQVYFNMEFATQNEPTHLIDNLPKNKHLSFSPYLTPGHVALLCVVGGNDYLHVDASCSISFNNVLLLRRNFTNISYTYINYQMLEMDKFSDEVDGRYASGNCAIFMCLNLLRFIVHYDEYKKPMDFNAFWQRLSRVVEKTNLDSSIVIIQNLFCNIKYMKLTQNGKLSSDYCQSVRQIRNDFDVPASYMDLKAAIGSMSDDIDFRADCVILDLFIASDMGFHDITMFGNKLRELVRQMTVHGFVNSYCKMFF